MPDVEEVLHSAIGETQFGHGFQLFGDDRFWWIRPKSRFRCVQQCRKLDFNWRRHDGVPETDIDLDHDAGRCQLGPENQPDATDFHRGTNRLAGDLLEYQTIRFNRRPDDITKERDHFFNRASAQAEQVEILSGAMRHPFPHGEECRAF